MFAYDITVFLRTAYRPFAYCVPSKHPLNTAYKKGGVTLNNAIKLKKEMFGFEPGVDPAPEKNETSTFKVIEYSVKNFK